MHLYKLMDLKPDGNIAMKSPRFEDRKILPYAEAFINEIFRHTSFLLFTIPQCATADTTLNGFHSQENMHLY
ncbi:hypothetical protein R6Z07F_002457 [Ovis aries]